MIELQSLHLGPLRNLNMALPEGSLYAMFGPTNSGKSLLALLGRSSAAGCGRGGGARSTALWQRSSCRRSASR